ncbi:hypothetical protein [Nocardioides sp.]|uniref:hypothetical protein n=1 Tax=Nocardioides sp. TaxID=35761 RepID=UPI0026202BBA|nr:hypothetical protein [Nocardioides sp.]MDI6911713.1 hypothetical protein [Nocardioides sp.]
MIVEWLDVPVEEDSTRWIQDLNRQEAIVCEMNSDIGPTHLKVAIYLPADSDSSAACRELISRWRQYLNADPT